MTVLLFIFIIIEFFWLLSLQDSISGLKFQINRLQQGVPQPPKQPAPAQPAAPAEVTKPAPVQTAAAATKPATEAPIMPAAAPRTESTKEAPSFTLSQAFSWIGGFILLLAIGFWIKYALENNLISPQLRITSSLIFGAGLWISGALLRKPQYKVTSDTLCASGLCIGYIAFFSAYYFYQMLSLPLAFALLGVTSLAAFGTAVWKESKYIGFLAQIIGFLTPFLFHTTEPNWFFIFAYIAFIASAATAAATLCKWEQQILSCIVFAFLCLWISLWRLTPADIHLLGGFILFFNLLFGFAAHGHKDGEYLLCSSIGTFILLGSYGVVCWQNNTAYACAFILWTLVLTVAFFVPVLGLRRVFENDKPAWLGAWIAGLMGGIYLYLIARISYEWDNGLIPLLLTCIYALIAYWVYIWAPLDEENQRFRLAGLGGITTFFLTFTLACQLKNEWLTISLALEGLALIALNQQLRIYGLNAIGKWLLVGTAARLLINPAVMGYHEASTKIFNWILYTYGLSAVAMLTAAAAWRPREDTKPIFLLQLLGGLVLFAMINLQIADFFSTSGTLEFNLTGSMAEAAAYTIAWALCGAFCVLLSIGTDKASAWLLQGGIGLMIMALAKLFLADIWMLETGSRIMVLLCVAVILILVSFSFQTVRGIVKTGSKK